MAFLIISIIVGGLIIGALGRLVVPGPNPIGVVMTIVVGVLGAIIGGIISRALFVDPAHHIVVTLIIEVLVAALLVAMVGRRRSRVR